MAPFPNLTDVQQGSLSLATITITNIPTPSPFEYSLASSAIFRNQSEDAGHVIKRAPETTTIQYYVTPLEPPVSRHVGKSHRVPSTCERNTLPSHLLDKMEII